MKRAIVGIGLAGPPVILAFLVLDPGGRAAALAAEVPLALGALVVASVASWTGSAVWLASEARAARQLRQLVAAAERMADGEHDAPLPHQTSALGQRLATALEGLSASISAKHEAATVDRLTGVANRTALLGALVTEVERAGRYDRPLSVAFVDIDHFKAVNDTYGHTAGDIVLRGVAQALKAHLRASDTIGRYGGEEFMLILPETTVEDAGALGEKLRGIVARQRFVVEGARQLSVTVSVGIAGGVGRALRYETLTRDADAAMYTAKALGRNQTYIFSEPDEDARSPPVSRVAGRASPCGGHRSRGSRRGRGRGAGAVLAPLPGHKGRPSVLVATIATALAERLDLPEQEVDRIRLAALLRDVGKVVVPADVLDKPGRLTPGEWQSIVQHPQLGQVILERAAALREAVPIILHHHEQYSGNGYPFGLRGNDIPLGARIVAIADAYQAMTEERPYRRALSHEAAIRELRRNAGTQFDPELVALFVALYPDTPPVPDREIDELLRPLNLVAADGTPLAADGTPLPLIRPATGSGPALAFGPPAAGEWLNHRRLDDGSQESRADVG